MTADDVFGLASVCALVAIYFWFALEPAKRIKLTQPRVRMMRGGRVSGPTTVETKIAHPSQGMVDAWRVKHCRSTRQVALQMIWKSGETLRAELERRQREEMGA